MLRDKIAEDLRTAMKAREKTTVDTLRMVLTAMKNLQVERGHEPEDAEVLEVLAREAKLRRESIEAFGNAGRQELVDKEAAQLAVLATYLPEQLSAGELGALVEQAIAQVGATSVAEMGAVMKALMPTLKGRADGTAVSAAVRARLGT